MLFEFIDKREHCKSIYTQNRILSDYNLKDLTGTWDYHPHLRNLDIKYAYLYANGRNIDQVCPDFLKSDWERVKQKHFAFINSFKQAKVSIGNNCFYDLVPEDFIHDFFSVKCKISEYVLETYEKPPYYDFLVNLSDMVYDISKRKLNIDRTELYDHLINPRARSLMKRLKQGNRNYIKYNIFGTITGRMSTYKNSFAILNLDKKFRSILKPNNDIFVEMDFNATDLRTMLALNDREQPEMDIHEWHMNIFKEDFTRDQIKQKIFAWLYGAKDDTIPKTIQEAYDKQNIKDKYWDGINVVNPFGRKISADDHHAVNTVIQSTAWDIFARQALKIYDMLKSRKTYIAWLIHDSLVLDYSLEDKDILSKLVSVLAKTSFGNFKVNLKAGKDFGRLRSFKCLT